MKGISNAGGQVNVMANKVGAAIDYDINNTTQEMTLVTSTSIYRCPVCGHLEYIADDPKTNKIYKAYCPKCSGE